jgi:hypothetical protein
VLFRGVSVHCGSCNGSLEARFFGLCSGLGAPVTICKYCGAPNNTGRAEWADMETRQRLSYVGVSLLYVAAVGYGGAYSWLQTSNLWLRQESDPDPLDFAGMVSSKGFLVWGLVAASIQLYRVAASARQKEKLAEIPSHALLTLQSWLQLKLLLVLILIPCVAWPIRRVV